MASSTARLLRTGSVPGRPRQTGQVLALGAIAEARGAAAENFGVGEELGVDFQADDGLVFGQHFRRDPHRCGIPRHKFAKLYHQPRPDFVARAGLLAAVTITRIFGLE